jgi:dihydroneopterin aldolase
MPIDSSLENLEFFDSFSVDDPLDLDDNTPQDPNANVKPDILGGEDFDPLADEEEEDDLPNPPVPKAPEPVEEEEEEEEEEEVDLEGDDDEEENYFEIFGKGLVKAGMLDVADDEDIEWNEQTFLAKMSETIEDRAWNQLEEMAVETYGEAGVQMIEDIFINKVPVQEYLQRFANEQIVENVDLSVEENQERVFRLYLAKTGMDEDEIQDQLNYARDNDRLEAYSQKYHVKLIEKMQQERAALAQESEARVQAMRQKEEEREQLYADVLDGAIASGSIEGYPINEQAASELFDFVLSKPHVLPNGQRISDFEYKLAKMRQEDPSKFLAVAKLVQSDLDLTPVKRKAVTEETNTLFNDLKTKSKKSTKAAKSNDDLFSRYFK